MVVGTGHYDFLREVVPGDVVFSYADGAVRGAGFAISYCYTCPRPAEFGHIGEAWDIVGWRVDVRFQRFAAAVRPRPTFQSFDRCSFGKIIRHYATPATACSTCI